jgi:hypothetical protein
MSKISLSGNPLGTGTFTIASPNSNTDRTVVLPDGNGDVVLTDATQTLTNKSISGAQINSGTVAVARLGSGTPGTGNFLRGDGSWQTVPASAPSTTDVLNATAGATAGAVGTYALLWDSVARTNNQGQTQAGSDLRYAASSTIASDANYRNSSPSGTWQIMGVTGYVGGVADTTLGRRTSVWLRIS